MLKWKLLAAAVVSCLFSGVLRAEIEYIEGPAEVSVGDVAKLKIPGGSRFVQQKDCKEFYQMTENFYSKNAMGVLIKQGVYGNFLVFFEFDKIGYIKDAASEKLDADKMWNSLVEDSKQANKARLKKGWTAMEPVRWELKPNYNAATQRLEWAYRFRSNSEEVVNFNTRVLGRHGVMRAILVPEGDVRQVMGDFNDIISRFEFKTGNKYAEWVKGDKVAKYGLAALVVGGATAAAVNSGLLAKFWKFIVAIGVALLAFLKKIWDVLTGRANDKPYTGGSNKGTYY